MPPPPFRADQVGSLIRPQYLLDARAAGKQWLESDQDHRPEAEQTSVQEAAKEAEHRAIKDALSEQIQRGILPLSSGEFERSSFIGTFFEALDGIEMKFAPW